MAIKIIERGQPEKVYKVVCQKCKSKLEFTKEDVEGYGEDYLGRYLRIVCPVCSEGVKSYYQGEIQ
jgi:hypothetical protein